jgi:heme-degrading monooxygenase HmoA
VAGVYTYLWEFDVAPESAAEFERHYGPTGTWARLFARAAGYLGTSLLKDPQAPGRYLTIDRWQNEQAYQAFRSEFAAQYAELDRDCERLTSGERSLGAFIEHGD